MLFAIFITGLVLLIFLAGLILAGIIISYGEHGEKIKEVKREQGIIWNPLKIGTIVYMNDSSNKRMKEFGPLDIAAFCLGSFIVQFFVSRKEKEKLSKKLFHKLYKKYIEE